MTIRPSSHAGSWYSADSKTLCREIKQWLSSVPTDIDSKSIPIAGARIIIAPHAGYAYSGPAAAYAYATLSLTLTTRRIFILGPSHTTYMARCALTSHSHYNTPAGPLAIDTATVTALRDTGRFGTMTLETDEREHSIEMHLPFIHFLITRTFKSPENYPSIVPILVGDTEPVYERDYGHILAPYLANTENIFIISSDFCHWGHRFDYTYYLPEGCENSKGHNLKIHDPDPNYPPIHDSIARLDRLSMDAIEGGSYVDFLHILNCTRNTVCGRHPIGIAMAMMEILNKYRKNWFEEKFDSTGTRVYPDDLSEIEIRQRNFKFIRYERSSDVIAVSDSSVSYASAYATI